MPCSLPFRRPVLASPLASCAWSRLAVTPRGTHPACAVQLGRSGFAQHGWKKRKAASVRCGRLEQLSRMRGPQCGECTLLRSLCRATWQPASDGCGSDLAFPRCEASAERRLSRIHSSGTAQDSHLLPCLHPYTSCEAACWSAHPTRPAYTVASLSERCNSQILQICRKDVNADKLSLSGRPLARMGFLLASERRQDISLKRPLPRLNTKASCHQNESGT